MIITDSMLPLKNGTVITVGNFDGVHRGHQALINEVCRIASTSALTPVVWTFGEHPSIYNNDNKDNKKGLICTRDEKIRLIGSLGVDRIYLADFMKYRDIDPYVFVKDILCRGFNAKTVICGYDFRFGAGAKGDTERLSVYLSEAGAECVVMPPFKVGGIVVSSSEIRKRLANGEIETVSELLGRHYYFDLPVVHGLGNGRKLGFPTVNQKFPEGLSVPCFGVYAVRCTVGDKTYEGIADIGIRPTVNEQKKDVLCEAHLFDFEGELYGRTVRTELIRMIRKEIRFPSFSELKTQINDDILRVKSFFS